MRGRSIVPSSAWFRSVTLFWSKSCFLLYDTCLSNFLAASGDYEVCLNIYLNFNVTESLVAWLTRCYSPVLLPVPQNTLQFIRHTKTNTWQSRQVIQDRMLLFKKNQNIQDRSQNVLETWVLTSEGKLHCV